MSRPPASQALARFKVLDLTRVRAGPTCVRQLADWGADVIKIEMPEDDGGMGGPRDGPDFQNLHRNKRSVTLDLKSPKGVEIFRELVKRADVVVENFRPDVKFRLRIDYESLKPINKRLVYASISGFGQDGPYRRRPGFGTLIEGMSGFAAINGFADREPVLPPIYLADGVAGIYGASAAMIALREVEQNGGRGQVIDLPLLDPLFAIMSPQAANYRLTGRVKPRTGSRSTNTAPRNAYRCKDGKFVGLSASTQKMAERTFRAIGRPDLVEDPRYRTNADRLARADELDAIIGAFIAQRTQAENVAFFEEAEVTIGPIYDVTQILEDPHVVERELVADYPDPDMGTLPMHHVVPRLSGTPGSIRTPAPKLGQHNEEILKSLGLKLSDIKNLKQKGVVAGET